MVISNFERALVGLSEHRLGTEWTIFVNAVLAMLLILCFPRERRPNAGMIARPRYGLWTAVFVFVGLTGLRLGTTVFTAAIHRVYGERHDNWGGASISALVRTPTGGTPDPEVEATQVAWRPASSKSPKFAAGARASRPHRMRRAGRPRPKDQPTCFDATPSLFVGLTRRFGLQTLPLGDLANG